MVLIFKKSKEVKQGTTKLILFHNKPNYVPRDLQLFNV